MPNPNLDYELLRHLADEPAASQRGLAERLGVSVGKVNYCLRALVDKGWVKANNFRRSDKKLAYAYLLTPTGASAKLRLTRDFLGELKATHGEQAESVLRCEEVGIWDHVAELSSEFCDVREAAENFVFHAYS